MTTTTYQSHLMSVYNLVRAAAASGHLDSGRVNRAFGILQSRSQDVTNHHASINSCSCPDAKFRSDICKHRISRMMQVRINEREEAVVYQQMHYKNVRMR